MASSSTPSIVSLFKSFIQGLRLVDGGELAQLASLSFGAGSGFVALAGGGQTNATQLIGASASALAVAEVDTVANANDSVMLPPAIPGTNINVNNATATSLQVFGQVGDTIAASGSSTQQPTATGVAHAANSAFDYTCYKLGQWKQH